MLKKRGFPNTCSFYVDYESMHEIRVEKVAYYMLDYIREWARSQRHEVPPADPVPTRRPLFPWQG